MDGVQTKKNQSLPKSVPWEPYKGATSAKHKSNVPDVLPPLIPYRISLPSRSKDIKKSDPSPQALTNNALTDNHSVNVNSDHPLSGKSGSTLNGNCFNEGHEKDVKDSNSDIVEELRNELLAERKLSAELKKLLVASMGDDISCHIQSLSEDKVRLASKMNSFAAQSYVDHDRAEDLQIMSDMWRCKFLAMSVRADELTAQRAHLFDYLRKEHEVLKNLMAIIEHFPLDTIPPDVLSTAQSLLAVDISQFCERTPCDEKLCRPHPVTSNITVSCCKNCAAHEIKLL